MLGHIPGKRCRLSGYCLQDTPGDEGPQTCRQNALRNAKSPLEVIEASHAIEGVTNDQERPPVADGIEGSCDRAIGFLEACPFHNLLSLVAAPVRELTIPEPDALTAPALSRAVTLLFSVACGLAVANVYYAQPLLDAMATEFNIGHAVIGLVMTITQIGYGLGLLLVVPLGDLLDRRRLVVGQSLLTAIALIVVAFAPSAGIMLAGMAAVGLLTVVTQVLVAYAGILADPSQRGRVVGVVTSGVIIGIVLALYRLRDTGRSLRPGARSISYRLWRPWASRVCSSNHFLSRQIAANKCPICV